MTHTVVIGAGIMGAAIAEALTRVGGSVTVVDGAAPGNGATRNSLGWINANNRRPHSYHELAVAALQEWQDLARRHHDPAWFHPTGNLSWAETEQQRSQLAQHIERLRALNYPVKEVTHAQASELEPALRIPRSAQIAHYPAEGFVEGRPAVDALLNVVKRAGCEVIDHDPVIALRLNAEGVKGVALSSGRGIRGDQYICAAGLDTPRLLGDLGKQAPLMAPDIPGARPPCLVATVAVERLLVGRLVQGPKLKIRPVGERAVRLEASDINLRVDMHTRHGEQRRLAEQLLARAQSLVPGLAPRGQLDHDTCVRPMPIDGHPITGWLPDVPNLYVAVTHSGITFGPLLGKLIAREVLDHGPQSPLEKYRPIRFVKPVPPDPDQE